MKKKTEWFRKKKNIYTLRTLRYVANQKRMCIKYIKMLTKRVIRFENGAMQRIIKTVKDIYFFKKYT